MDVVFHHADEDPAPGPGGQTLHILMVQDHAHGFLIQVAAHDHIRQVVFPFGKALAYVAQPLLEGVFHLVDVRSLLEADGNGAPQELLIQFGYGVDQLCVHIHKIPCLISV